MGAAGSGGRPKLGMRFSSTWKTPRGAANLNLPAWIAFAVVVLFLSSSSWGQEELPGLLTKIEGGGALDVRVDRLPAVYVEQGQAVSPFIAPGQFKITWTGYLNLRFRQEYAFGAAGRGEVKVTLDGKPLLTGSGADLSQAPLSQRLKVKKGATPITIEYTSPADGSADFRLLFAEKGKNPEPPMPTLFTHDSSDVDLQRSQQLRRGRQLFADLRCFKCHAPDASQPFQMPEMSADVPALHDVGSRLNAPFVAKWVKDPKVVRPDSAMPAVIKTEQDANHIAAYLATLQGAKLPRTPEFSANDVSSGARVFTSLGCVGCHTAPDAAQTDPARVPLAHVAQKYQPSALLDYLETPEARFHWTKMPNFRLNDDELRQLSAYVLAKARKPEDASVNGDAQRGRQLFRSSGCIQCHDLPVERNDSAPALSRLKEQVDQGCLADAVHDHSAPDYKLSQDDRAALRAFLTSGAASLSQDHPSEIAQRHVQSLNCVACHARDQQPDRWAALGDEIAAIERDLPATEEKHHATDRPSLTWVGDKLRPQWAEAFIKGEVPYKPRPWMTARMPSFSRYAPALAIGMAAQHGLPSNAADNRKPNTELAEIGRRLAGTQGGFSCIQCHGIGSTPPIAPFEAPAPNFMYISDRLREDYYHRWMRNPGRLEPGTRMPQFSDPSGKTSLRDVLEGDAQPQFEALWHYLLQGQRITPP